MAHPPYLTAPVKTTKMPPGIPYIIGNEAAERFNFYGMRAILVVFMTQYLVNRAGAKDVMGENDANAWYHWFVASNYFFPMLGAIIADAFWGKYRTIFWVSLVYCAGSVVLAFDHTRLGLGLGLGLIALGAGGIKPCVSSHVGDQFGPDNQPLLSRAFGWFYFSVNFGSFLSILLIPWLLEHYGPGAAFGVPAVLMLVAAWVFWLGRYKFAHIPPTGGPFIKTLFNLGAIITFLRVVGILLCVGSVERGWLMFAQTSNMTFQPVISVCIYVVIAVAVFWPVNRLLPKPRLSEQCRAGWAAIGRIAIIFAFVAIFWSLWDQSGGEWVLQAQKMDLHFLGITWLASQIQAVNAIMILAFIPLFQYVIYPAISKIFPLTPLRKIGLGLVVTGLSFLISAWIETRIGAGLKPSIGWQMPAYALLSAGEVMVSITSLEFAYTQAPKAMKSIIMSLYLLSISAGNAFTALVHVFIANPDGTVKLQGAAYYNFFALLSIGCVAVFVFVAKAYKEKSYLQGEMPVPLAEAAAET